MKFVRPQTTVSCLVTTALLAGCGSPTPTRPTVLGAGDAARNQQLARDDTDRAFDLIGRSDFGHAEQLLKSALGADPLYGPAHNDLGLVYYHRDDWYNAAWEFENASELMTRQAPPVNNLGLVYEKTNQLTKAETAFAKAVELDPGNPEYAGNCARARIKLGKRDQATADLLELVILKDRRPAWIAWAREQSSRISRPATRPGE